MPLNIQDLTTSSINLLKEAIKICSFSKKEDGTAALIFDHIQSYDLNPKRQYNNVYVCSDNFGDKDLPLILLNSHHDTVRPGNNWKSDPFDPVVDGDVLYGLGSNDAGASFVSLLSVFLYLNSLSNLPYRLIVAITAEEEISGEKGIRVLLPELGKIDLGIVGEPTQMNVAVAEKGLIVLDCITRGKTGHAAREEGENALYKSMEDIHFIKNHSFEKTSDLLGKVKMTVTQIEAGSQHNVVPDTCHYVVDIRTNECYSNLEVIAFLKKNLRAEITSRSYHLNSSSISASHPIVKQAVQLGYSTFGSVTLSDQAVMDFPTIKMGPGDSARSHTPNEYIKLSEIRDGIEKYIELLKNLNLRP